MLQVGIICSETRNFMFHYYFQSVFLPPTQFKSFFHNDSQSLRCTKVADSPHKDESSINMGQRDKKKVKSVRRKTKAFGKERRICQYMQQVSLSTKCI